MFQNPVSNNEVLNEIDVSIIAKPPIRNSKIKAKKQKPQEMLKQSPEFSDNINKSKTITSKLPCTLLKEKLIKIQKTSNTEKRGVEHIELAQEIETYDITDPDGTSAAYWVKEVQILYWRKPTYYLVVHRL